MKKPLFFFVLLFLISNISFGLKTFVPTESLVVDGNNWKIFKTENISMGVSDKEPVFRLDESSEDQGAAVDLLLDFESKNIRVPNYRVLSSKYELNQYQSVNGKYSGKFFMPEQSVSLLPLTTSLFTPGNNPGSFTIEFWLYFYKTYDDQIVIRYAGNDLTDDSDTNVYGFSVQTKNNRIEYRFNNFFLSAGNESYSFRVEEEEPIQPYTWEHHAITFNIMNGKLTAYKNGIEQGTIRVAQSDERSSPILSPMVNEKLSSPIVIGQNGCFAMDNLKVLRDARSAFYLKKYKDQESKVVTDVYKIADNIITIKKLGFRYDNPDQSFLKLAYRISDHYFLPDNKDLKWVYVQNNIENFPSGYQEGKYIQYKVTAYPNEDQDKEIVIRSIKLDYEKDTAPYAPTITRIDAMDGKAKITWIPTPEDDIVGYELYYGNRTENYISSDAHEGKSPIFVTNIQSGKILKMETLLTGLVNERPYYISIRSVDRHGHRSPFSSEMYVRPSTVYNDNRYSVGN